MERRDLELIKKLSSQDVFLRQLYDEHVSFEKKLEKLDRKPFLNREEELERKRLQKLKLQGRDRIEEILTKHRKKGSART